MAQITMFPVSSQGKNHNIPGLNTWQKSQCLQSHHMAKVTMSPVSPHSKGHNVPSLTTRQRSQCSSSSSVCFRTLESNDSPNHTTWGRNNPPQPSLVQRGNSLSGIRASGAFASGSLCACKRNRNTFSMHVFRIKGSQGTVVLVTQGLHLFMRHISSQHP